jgi:hypothetical protein
MRIPFSRSVLTLALLAGAFMTVRPAEAAIIGGVLNITGSVAVSADALDFLPGGGGVGDFAVDPFTQTGDFVPLAGTTGEAADLNSATEPVGVPISLPNFLTFAANPNLTFTLTFIRPGIFSPAACADPPAAGQVCTPPGSQFNLNNLTSDSSTATFAVRGFVSDGSSDPVSPFEGTFSTQFTNNSYQELLGTIGAGGSVQATYSANFIVTPIPEPGTVSMLVLGGLMMAVPMIRRRRS